GENGFPCSTQSFPVAAPRTPAHPGYARSPRAQVVGYQSKQHRCRYDPMKDRLPRAAERSKNCFIDPEIDLGHQWRRSRCGEELRRLSAELKASAPHST